MTGIANTPRNVILNADCIDAMRSFDRGAVDFVLTDPPYLVNYRDRNGRKVANDDNARWLRPAFNQMHRVLKDGGFAVSFLGDSPVTAEGACVFPVVTRGQDRRVGHSQRVDAG